MQQVKQGTAYQACLMRVSLLVGGLRVAESVSSGLYNPSKQDTGNSKQDSQNHLSIGSASSSLLLMFIGDWTPSSDWRGLLI